MEPTFWDESSLNNTIKCEGGNAGPSTQVKDDQSLFRYVEGNLNFSTVASEDDDYGYHKKKLSRDPLSHRIIEKRRRDRMNNCLADLSRLLPSEYMKKGRGRIEKTEIIEMAIKHMKHLQSHPCTEGGCCPVAPTNNGNGGLGLVSNGTSLPDESGKAEHYRLGFHDCLTETMHFLVEVEGFFAGDTLCVQLVSHLHRHCDSVLKGHERLSTRLGSGGGGGGGVGLGGIKEEVEKIDVSPPHLTNGSTNSSPSPQSQGSVESSNGNCTSSGSGNGGHSGGGPLYKFKNNIRKRFANERATGGIMVGGGGVIPVGANNSCSTNAIASPGVLIGGGGSLVGGGVGGGLGGGGVPVFALSSRGSYYVPLSLDYALLSPHLLRADSPEDEEPVLHPVAISVNFRPRH